MLEQNNLAIKTFFHLIFNSMKQDITELGDENLDLKRSLEFSQSEIDSLKKLQPDVHTIDKRRNKISIYKYWPIFRVNLKNKK